MMPLGTEQRPQDTVQQSDSCRSRLLELQEEFRKMEGMVANMRRYKAKIDQLKQENASLKFSYEVNLQKYCNHISTLERDNVLVRSHIKKMDAQLHGKGDDRDRSKLLLERLRMLESENSSLVLENEQQRQQYEKCLDEIANQVIQALLAQKTLREECSKLQSRVQDLEMQNKHLNIMFQQRMMVASEGLRQIRDNSLNSSQVSIPCFERKKLPNHGAKVDSSDISSIFSSISEAQERTTLERRVPTAKSCSKLKQIIIHKRRATSLEHGLFCSSSWKKRFGCQGKQVEQELHSLGKDCFPVSRLRPFCSADNINYPCTDDKPSFSQMETLELYNSLSWNTDVPHFRPSNIIGSHSDNGSLARGKLSPATFRAFTNCFKEHLLKTSADTARTYSSGSHFNPAESTSLPSQKSSTVPSHSSVMSSVSASLASHSLTRDNESILPQSVRHLDDCADKSVNPPAQNYYYDYSDEDSDTRPTHRHPSRTPSTVSRNELLNYSLDKQTELNDNVFFDWSTMCVSPTTRSGSETGVSVSDDDKVKNLSTPSNSKSHSLFSLVNQTAFSKSSIRVIASTQMKATNAIETGQTVARTLSKVTPDTKQNKNDSLASHAKGKNCDKLVSETISGKVKTKMMKSTAEDKSVASSRSVEATAVYNRENMHLSAALNHESQNVGHSSKGSNLQSILPLSNRSITPWREPTNISETCSGKKQFTSIKTRDTKDMCSRLVSNGDRPGEGTKLTRPGQLILAPEEKNFNFKGFSSGSSTCSDDTSPLKHFESIHNFDMRSSVIEVKQDGTFVHAMRSIEDSNSETSTSLSASPSSPIKSPSKIPAPLVNKAARVLKSEARSLDNCKADSCKGEHKNVPQNTNITVGFLFQFPTKTHFEDTEHFIPGSMKELKNTAPSGQPKYAGGHVQTKCQSSDSSFENLRVERSGSKDDGYSTMSSDIHPEILEKFCDTLTRKSSMTECEPPVCAIKNIVPETLGLQNGVRRMSDPAFHGHDRSFDLMSDPDSALETSVHSTAEMVTSSSSQVSTSSSDYPLSPCSSNVSKIAKLLDGENTKLHFVHGSAKENYVSSSSKTSNCSMSPVSPNAFVPSCYQPPESPRRLTNEFQKSNSVKCSGSSTSFRKLSPGSPNTLNKSFGGFSLKQKQQTSGIPVGSTKKSLDTKLQAITKPQGTNPISPTGCIRFSKGQYSSAQEGAKNKPVRLTKEQDGKTAGQGTAAKTENVNDDVKSCAFTQEKTKNAKYVKQLPLPQAKKEGESRLKSVRVITPVSRGQHPAGKDNITRSSTVAPSKNNAGLTRAKDVAPTRGCKTEEQRDNNNAENNCKSTQNTRNAENSSVSNDTSDMCLDSKSVTCASGINNTEYKQKIVNTLDASKVLNSFSSITETITPTVGDHTPSRTCSYSNETEHFPFTSSHSAVSSAPTGRDIPHHQSQTNHHPVPAQTIKDPSLHTSPSQQQLKHYGRIVTTNQGFQQISDSENNDEESASIISAFVYENIKESGERENIDCDYSNVNNSNDCGNARDFSNVNNLPKSVRDFKCNLPTSNILTTKSVNAREHHQPPTSAISGHENIIFHMPKDILKSQTLISSNCAHVSKSSNDGLQVPQAGMPQPHVGMHQAFADMQQPHPSMQQPHPSMQQPHPSIQQQNTNVVHRNQNAYLPQVMKHINRPPISSKFQCLRRWRSVNDISTKPKTPSIYDQFFWVAWDSGKILEKSASLDEIALFNHRSWVTCQSDCRTMGFDETRPDHTSQLTTDHYTFRQQIPSIPSPPSVFLYLRHNHNIPQENPHYRHYSHHHHYHQQSQQRLYPKQNIPLPQTLPLDLSDVTEIDEDGFDHPTNINSLYSSHTGMTSDESPRANIDEQTAFNRQFYSLCKVDSNRSLLSSGKGSREALSQTDFNDLMNGNLGRSPESVRETNTSMRNMGDMKGLAITEFDEISRQIASLSKTVDELNQSLSSLNSGEFEPSSHLYHGSSSFHPQESFCRPNVFDGFHWVDEDIVLSPASRRVIKGHDGASAQECNHNHPQDQSSTEDASSEFYQCPIHEHHNLFHCMNSTGQDEIFAGTLFDTVKEKPESKRKQRNLRAVDGSDETGRSVPAVAEKTVATSEICINGENKFRNEGGDNCERDMKHGEIKANHVFTQQGNEQADKLASSNNESDDSLASDIGLDRMMCQRLFGRKGCSVSSCSPSIDNTRLLMTYEDLLENMSDCKYRKQTSQGHVLRVQDEETSITSIQNVTSEEEVPAFLRDRCHRETRDVGIDVMSHSQNSLSNFETVDQSVPDIDKCVTIDNTSKHAPERLESFSVSKASSSRNIQKPGSSCGGKIDHAQDAVELNVVSHRENIIHRNHVLQESRLPSHSLSRRVGQTNANTSSSLTRHSHVAADLSLNTSAAIEIAPPKLPPRQPITSNTVPRAYIHRDIAPLPPPPACLDNERFHPSSSQRHNHQSRQHFPYVNQHFPTLPSKKSRNVNAGSMRDPTLSIDYECTTKNIPPPVPPRLPQISRGLESKSLDIRNHEKRPRSFTNCLLGNSKAALSSSSIASASSVSTYPGPKTQKHSEKLQHYKLTSSMEKPKDSTSESKIPRRRFRTRRARSRTSLVKEKPSGDAEVKNASLTGKSASKQWRDIDLVNGLPLSGSSCDDDSS